MLVIIATLVIAAILIWKERHMSAAFDRLSASIDAAVARINSTTDDAQLNALADKLDAVMPTTEPANDTPLPVEPDSDQAA